MEDAMTPRDIRAIVSSAQKMKANLDSHVVTSPLKAALASGILAAVVTKIMTPEKKGEEFLKNIAYGALIGGTLSHMARSWYVAGYKCGLCSSVSRES